MKAQLASGRLYIFLRAPRLRVLFSSQPKVAIQLLMRSFGAAHEDLELLLGPVAKMTPGDASDFLAALLRLGAVSPAEARLLALLAERSPGTLAHFMRTAKVNEARAMLLFLGSHPGLDREMATALLEEAALRPTQTVEALEKLQGLLRAHPRAVWAVIEGFAGHVNAAEKFLRDLGAQPDLFKALELLPEPVVRKLATPSQLTSLRDVKIVTPEYAARVAEFKGISHEEVAAFYLAELPMGIDLRTLVDAALVKYPKRSRAEAETIYGYTTKQWYRDLNRAQEAGGWRGADLADSLKKAIEKMPAAAKVQYRGLRLASPAEIAEFDAHFAVGKEVTSGSFWSCGPDPSNAYEGARNLVIETDSAKDISELAFGVKFNTKIGRRPYTAEAIIPPGVRFRVKDVDASTSRVWLEEVK